MSLSIQVDSWSGYKVLGLIFGEVCGWFLFFSLTYWVVARLEFLSLFYDFCDVCMV